MDTPSQGNAPFTKGNIRRSVLTPSKVLEIRAFYNKGHVTQGQLARDYGVSVVQIGRIVRGEVWQGLRAPESSREELVATAARLLALQQDMAAGLVEVEPEQPPSGLAKLAEEARMMKLTDGTEVVAATADVLARAKAYGAR